MGAGVTVLYALWAAWIPLLPANVFTPLLDLGKMTGYTWTSAVRYSALVAALYALYGLGYWLVRRGGAGVQSILLFGAAFCALLFDVYPATAVDVFAYVAQGRLIALHHVNPFLVAPNVFVGDAILPYLAYPGEPSQYGPVWAWLGAAIATITMADATTLVALPRELLLYKLVAASAHLGGAALVSLVAMRLGASRRDALGAAYLFAWNPLLLWEMVGNAHNDGVMVLGGLCALLALAARRYGLVLPAIVLGALVKIPIVAIAPLLTVVLWRRSRRATLISLAFALALIAAAYAPFWRGPATLTFLARGDLFTASLASSLWRLLTPVYGEAAAARLARLVTGGLLVVVLTPIVWRALRVDSDRRAVELAYWTMLTVLLLGITWFQAWYVVWPFALAVPLAMADRGRDAVLLSVGGMGTYLVFIYLWVMGVLPGGTTVVQLAACAALLGPLLSGWLVAALPRRSPLRPWSLTSAAR